MSILPIFLIGIILLGALVFVVYLGSMIRVSQKDIDEGIRQNHKDFRFLTKPILLGIIVVVLTILVSIIILAIIMETPKPVEAMFFLVIDHGGVAV